MTIFIGYSYANNVIYSMDIYSKPQARETANAKWTVQFLKKYFYRLCGTDMVLLGAKYDDAAALHILLWIHDNLFNIKLHLWTRGKKSSILIRESTIDFRPPEPFRPSPCWPDFQKKSHVKSVDLTKNYIFIHYIFLIKTKVILIDLWTCFYVKQSDCGNIFCFLSYIQKCRKKWQKTGFTRNALISKPKQNFASKCETTILKHITTFC